MYSNFHSLSQKYETVLIEEENEQGILHQLNEIECNQKTDHLSLQKYGEIFFSVFKVTSATVHHVYLKDTNYAISTILLPLTF